MLKMTYVPTVPAFLRPVRDVVSVATSGSHDFRRSSATQTAGLGVGFPYISKPHPKVCVIDSLLTVIA